jgi:hypothetical protein
MLLFILADDLLTDLGRIAALILVIYVFLFVVLFFVSSLLILYGNTWLRQQVRWLHQVRSIVENIDAALHAPSSETLPAVLEPDNSLGQALQVVHKVQSVQVVQIAQNTHEQVDSIGKRVEPVADRIAEGVIEFRARTVMLQGMLKAFFLPGSIKPKPGSPLLLPAPLPTGVSVNPEIPAGDTIMPGEYSNVVLPQPNLAHVGVQSASAVGPDPLVSEGAKRSDDAPGH